MIIKFHWKERRRICAICNCENPLDIILKDEIWDTIKPSQSKGGLLCPPCVEELLKRKIRLTDLKSCDITDVMKLGAIIALNGKLPSSYE